MGEKGEFAGGISLTYPFKWSNSFKNGFAGSPGLFLLRNTGYRPHFVTCSASFSAPRIRTPPFFAAKERPAGGGGCGTGDTPCATRLWVRAPPEWTTFGSVCDAARPGPRPNRGRRGLRGPEAQPPPPPPGRRNTCPAQKRPSRPGGGPRGGAGPGRYVLWNDYRPRPPKALGRGSARGPSPQPPPAGPRGMAWPTPSGTPPPPPNAQAPPCARTGPRGLTPCDPPGALIPCQPGIYQF